MEFEKLKFHGGFLLTSPLDNYFKRQDGYIHLNDDTPGYGSVNQSPSSAELEDLPLHNSSPHPRSSERSQPSSPLEHAGQSRVVTRRSTHQHQGEDSTA